MSLCVLCVFDVYLFDFLLFLLFFSHFVYMKCSCELKLNEYLIQSNWNCTFRICTEFKFNQMLCLKCCLASNHHHLCDTFNVYSAFIIHTYTGVNYAPGQQIGAQAHRHSKQKIKKRDRDGERGENNLSQKSLEFRKFPMKFGECMHHCLFAYAISSFAIIEHHSLNLLHLFVHFVRWLLCWTVNSMFNYIFLVIEHAFRLKSPSPQKRVSNKSARPVCYGYKYLRKVFELETLLIYLCIYLKMYSRKFPSFDLVI